MSRRDGGQGTVVDAAADGSYTVRYTLGGREKGLARAALARVTAAADLHGSPSANTRRSTLSPGGGAAVPPTPKRGRPSKEISNNRLKGAAKAKATAKVTAKASVTRQVEEREDEGEDEEDEDEEDEEEEPSRPVRKRKAAAGSSAGSGRRSSARIGVSGVGAKRRRG
jgi:hypothetical protein